MDHHRKRLLGLLLAMAASAAPAAAVPSGYTLTFSDEFDSIALDTDGDGNPTWAPWFVTWNAHYLVGNSDECYKTSNELIAEDVDLHLTGGGVLSLEGWKAVDVGVNTGQLDGKAYLGGMISADKSFSQQEGYWECRVRFTATKGHHWAMWLLQADGTWPPEIDMVEAVGHAPGELYMTAHWGTSSDHRSNFETFFYDWSQWHTYGFEWKGDTLTWYLDGNVLKTMSNTQPPYTVLTSPVYFLLTPEMDSNWTGPPDGTTQWPMRAEVDYVRVYEFTGGGNGEITVRARAVGSTGGRLHLLIDDVTEATWTLNSTSYQSFTHTTSASTANVKIQFEDNTGDAQVDYIEVGGTQYEAEDQATNTSVWQSGSCGGSFSELMHCWGHIDFGTLNLGGTSNDPPSVDLTAPAQGATFTDGDDVVLSANASDSDGSVTKVEFFHGSTLIGQDTGAPYGVTWNDVPEGSYTLTAKATDDDGAETTSAGVGITVAPAPGGGEITVRARALNGTGGRIQLRIDDVTEATWTLNSTSYQGFTHTTSASSANVKIHFEDNTGDAEVDYLQVGSTVYQAEDQATNTSVWQNGSCGGSFSQQMHCFGHIDFGTLSLGGSGGGASPFTIEAEDYSAQSGGIDTWTWIGGIDPGDWVRYDDVDLSTGFDSFRYNVAKGGSYSSTVEVRIDGTGGTKIGEFVTTSTGGWNTYEERTTSLSGASGVHDLYVVFPDGGPGNFDWWRFENGSAKGGSTAATATDGALPGDFLVEPNYPNPFNPETSIRYSLPGAGHVRLRVYDLQGRLVRSLVDGVQPGGWHAASWTGTDAQGRRVSSGIYVYRVTFHAPEGRRTESGKMLLLK